MKRFSVALMFCLLAAGVATAVPTVTVGRGPSYTYPVAPLSGEFQLTPNAELAAQLGSAAPFPSFCVEAYETITLGATYEALLNDEAILGDGLRPGELAGPGGGDRISPETAYLYTEFRAETLAGYDFSAGAGHAASALALQTAFWYLEGEHDYQELNALSVQAQGFVTLAQNAQWETIGYVRVLNLYELNAGKLVRQDMLTLAVPAPGALLLGSLGLGLVGWFRRRRAL